MEMLRKSVGVDPEQAVSARWVPANVSGLPFPTEEEMDSPIESGRGDLPLSHSDPAPLGEPHVRERTEIHEGGKAI